MRLSVIAVPLLASSLPQSRPLSKTSSLANLSDAKDKVSRSDGGGGGSGVLLGKPPPAPQALVTPVAVMLPKLQELLDHASAHQAALQASGDDGDKQPGSDIACAGWRGNASYRFATRR